MVATIVDWAALGKTAYVSALIGLGVLLLAGLAVVASLKAQDDRREGAATAAVAYGGVTVLCLAGLFAAVVYGIYLIAR
jgi:hypothetical protein